MKKIFIVLITFLSIFTCFILFKIVDYDRLSYNKIKKEFINNKETFEYIGEYLSDKDISIYTKDNYWEVFNHNKVPAVADKEYLNWSKEIFKKYPKMHIYNNGNYIFFRFGFNKLSKEVGIMYIEDENYISQIEIVQSLDTFEKILDNWFGVATMSYV